MRTPGATRVGDVFVALAGICLLAALVHPTLSARRFQQKVDGVTLDVETIRGAARTVRESAGSWPSRTHPAAAPAAVAGAFEEGATLDRDGYTIEWRTWEVVDHVPVDRSVPLPEGTDAPPPTAEPATMAVTREVGSISVHSGDDDLLAELSRRYGSWDSFVRDSTWTLMVNAGGRSP